MVHAKVGWVLTRVNSANGTPRFITHAPTQARGARFIAHSNDTRTRTRASTNRTNTWTRVIPTSFRGILHAPTNAVFTDAHVFVAAYDE